MKNNNSLLSGFGKILYEFSLGSEALSDRKTSDLFLRLVEKFRDYTDTGKLRIASKPIFPALQAGEKESAVMPLAETLAIAETLDRVREAF